MSLADDAVYSAYRTKVPADLSDTVRDLWAEVYGERPFDKGPDDVARFMNGWPRRLAAPGFGLVVATIDAEPVGCIYGHQLAPDTRWWNEVVEPLTVDTTERPGRTMAIIDMMVRRPWRRQGISRRLHAHLLADHTEERVTLLVRPDNEPARRAYEVWGYRKVGMLQPFPPNGPIYDSMIRETRR